MMVVELYKSSSSTKLRYFLNLFHGKKDAVFGSYPIPYLDVLAKSFYSKSFGPLSVGAWGTFFGNLLFDDLKIPFASSHEEQ